MSKICGVININRTEGINLCGKLCNNLKENYGLKHGIKYESNLLNYENACFGLLANDGDGNNIKRIETTNKICFCVGNIFPPTRRDELIYELNEAISANELYIAKNILTEFEGAFVYIHWNINTKSLTIINDKLGLYPLYIYRKNDQIIFASEAEAIAKLNLNNFQIDNNSIAEFISLGNILNGKSLFSNINNILPASINVFRNSQNIRIIYYSVKQKKLDVLSYSDLIDRLSTKFHNAVIRRIKTDPVVIRLSGGIDSRLILACLLEEKKEIHAETYFLRLKEVEKDALYSSALAKKYEFEHMCFPKASSTNLIDRIKGITKNPTYRFNGIWGGEIFGGTKFIRSRNILESAKRAFKDKFSNKFIATLTLCPEMTLNDNLRDLPFNHIESNYLYFYFTCCSRSFLSSEQGIGWERPNFFFFGNGLYPFTDCDFLELVFSLNPDFLKGRKLSIELLMHKHHDILNIPWMSNKNDIIKCKDDFNYLLHDIKIEEQKIFDKEYEIIKLKILKDKDSLQLFKNVKYLISPATELDLLIQKRYVLLHTWLKFWNL